MQINRQSYEEYFLLYADGELNESEKKAVEEFIDQNPDLAGELSIIQETVFKPDGGIVFDNKELLYKNESDEKKVIYMRWLRTAAAAAVLVLLSLAGWLFYGTTDKHTTPVTVVQKPEVKKIEPSDLVSANDTKKETVQQPPTVEKAKSRKNISLIVRSGKKQKEKEKEKEKELQPANQMKEIQNKDISNDPDVVDVVPPAKTIEGAAFTQDAVPSEPVKETIDVAVEPRSMENNNSDQHLKDVSYAQSFKQESDDDIIYFANTSLTKKTKLRGVLRKATRYLDRVTSLQ
jgi:hypothetical protein